MLPFRIESGILLEGANVLLPWHTKITDLHQVGKALVTKTSDTITVQWRGEACLGGLACEVETTRVLGAPDPRAYHIYLETFHWARLRLDVHSGLTVRERLRWTFRYLKRHFGDPGYFYADYGGIPALMWDFPSLKVTLGCDFGTGGLQVTIRHEPPNCDSLRREAARIAGEDGPGDLQKYTDGSLDL